MKQFLCSQQRKPLNISTALSQKSIENPPTMIRHKVYQHCYKGKGKGKAIPVQAWTDPEVSRSLRFPDFKTIST